MSIEQSGNSIHVSFSAAYTDAHGAAPDGGGQAKIVGKNMLEFNWEDSFQNSGTGTIKRTGDGITASMKTMRVVDSRCLVFYGDKMRLKRVKKYHRHLACGATGRLAWSGKSSAGETPTSPTARMAVLLYHWAKASDDFL